MEQYNSAGLYLARDRATAVWMAERDHGTVVATLSIMPSDEQSPQTIALDAARRIARQGDPVDHLVVALDCSYYTQYSLQSEFSDIRQIESTIKFDAEEAAAADAMNLAVTFVIVGSLPIGSEVTAFAADRQTATDILLDVQEGGLDPVMMEPDAVCLARVLERTLAPTEHPDTLYVLAGARNCYLLQPSPVGYAPKLRSFLLGDGPQRTAALMREILAAMAGWDEANGLKTVLFVHPCKEIDSAQLAERTGLTVKTEPAVKQLAIDDAVDLNAADEGFLIATGAALAGINRGQSADFRRDFMPYQGKRKMMESSLRLAGISLAVLLAAVAIFFQMQIYRVNSYTHTLDAKLVEEYRGAMYGANPPTAEALTSRLRRTVVNAKRLKDGLGPGDDKSIQARLTFLLEAVNDSPASVDFKIDQIWITDRTMRVKGDTNSRRATLDLFESIKKHPNLRFGSERMSMVGARDTFEFTIEPTQ